MFGKISIDCLWNNEQYYEELQTVILYKKEDIIQYLQCSKKPLTNILLLYEHIVVSVVVDTVTYKTLWNDLC